MRGYPACASRQCCPVLQRRGRGRRPADVCDYRNPRTLQRHWGEKCGPA